MDDDVGRIAPVAQELDVRQDFERSVTPAGDVFGQAHDEGVFIAHIHHQGGDVRLAQDAKSIQPPLPADQHVSGLTVFARALGHGDGLFEADELNALDDLFKDLHVAVAGVNPRKHAVAGKKSQPARVGF